MSPREDESESYCMWRANIYSLEPLPAQTRDAVHDGVGMVAAYMDQPMTTKELRINLPLNKAGRVDPARVGFGKLDKLVELHLMAVLLDPGENESIGLAGFGGGWGFVDVSEKEPDIIRTSTAHEVSHAFGFVTPGAEQAAPESEGHCRNHDCLMHQKTTLINSPLDELFDPEFIKNIWQSRKRRREQRRTVQPASRYVISSQFDFCQPCKLDLRHEAGQKLAQLRSDRLFRYNGVR